LRTNLAQADIERTDIDDIDIEQRWQPNVAPRRPAAGVASADGRESICHPSNDS